MPRARAAGVLKAPRHEVAGSWAPAKQRALWELRVAPLSMISAAPARADGHACRVTNESIAGISAGTRSTPTGGWWDLMVGTGSRGGNASQNASATSTFRHECCKRGDLMFAACLISNGCALRKWHPRQLARD